MNRPTRVAVAAAAALMAGVPHPDPGRTGRRPDLGAASQDGQRTAAQYDAMAALYATANADGPFTPTTNGHRRRSTRPTGA